MAALLIILLTVAAYIVPDAERAILAQFYNGTVGSKVPTPAPPHPSCTGESANLTAGDCAAWTRFAKDPRFSSVLVARVREIPRYA